MPCFTGFENKKGIVSQSMHAASRIWTCKGTDSFPEVPALALGQGASDGTSNLLRCKIRNLWDSWHQVLVTCYTNKRLLMSIENSSFSLLLLSRVVLDFKAVFLDIQKLKCLI